MLDYMLQFHPSPFDKEFEDPIVYIESQNWGSMPTQESSASLFEMAGKSCDIAALQTSGVKDYNEQHYIDIEAYESLIYQVSEVIARFNIFLPLDLPLLSETSSSSEQAEQAIKQLNIVCDTVQRHFEVYSTDKIEDYKQNTTSVCFTTAKTNPNDGGDESSEGYHNAIRIQAENSLLVEELRSMKELATDKLELQRSDFDAELTEIETLVIADMDALKQQLHGANHQIEALIAENSELRGLVEQYTSECRSLVSKAEQNIIGNMEAIEAIPIVQRENSELQEQNMRLRDAEKLREEEIVVLRTRLVELTEE